MRGGPWTAPPGAPADLNPPSALPEWAAVTGGSCRARPPYCSGAPPCAAPKLGARVAPARWCGPALRPRPPREQATGGAGARSVQVQPHPPPPPRVAVPSWGGGGVSSAPKGAGGPLLWFPSWGGGERGGGVGGLPPPLPPRRASACHPLSLACPPRVYSFRGGCRAAAGVGRGPVSCRRASAAGGGGGGGAALFAPSWAPLVRRWPAAGGACGRLPRPRCPRTPGAAASSGGVRGCRFFGLPPSAHGTEWEGGGGGGGPLVPSRRLLTSGGGAAWLSRPRGPAIGWGVAPFPLPPLSRAGPFAASGASRCFTSGLQRWAPSRSPML